MPRKRKVRTNNEQSKAGVPVHKNDYDTVYCHLCSRFFDNVEVLKKHLEKEHQTTLVEYSRVHSINPVKVSENVVHISDFLTALVYYSVHGKWPEWFNSALAVEVPKGSLAVPAAIAEMLAVLYSDRIKSLLLQASMMEQKLLSESLSSDKDSLRDVIEFISKRLVESSSTFNDLMANLISAKKVVPASIVVNDRTYVDARTVNIETNNNNVDNGKVPLDSVDDRAKLLHGVSLLVSLLNGNKNHNVPPTQDRG